MGVRAAAAALVVVSAWLGSAGAAPDPWADEQLYRITYTADLPALEVGAGEKVRVWLPLPARSLDQEVLAEEVTAEREVRVAVDSRGNRMAYLELEGRPREPLVLRATVLRRPSSGVPTDAVVRGDVDDPARFLAPARLIPLHGLIGRIAEREAKGRGQPSEKVRAYYEYVVENLSYDKSGTGWGQGNAIWACTRRRGNCTDFHSLFIGLARSQGIPARFVIGFPIPAGRSGRIPGYHCWAEFWDEARGWVPLDSSEAKKTGRVDRYFGRLPSDRIQFTTGRDLVLEPPQDGEPLNYFIHPYVEVAGRPTNRVPIGLEFQRLDGPRNVGAAGGR